MRTIAIPASALVLAAALFGAGCAGTSAPPPSKTVETSYPSPDYPPQTATAPRTTPAPQPAASQTLPPPAGPAPAAPTPLAATPAPAPAATTPPAAPMRPPVPPRGEGGQGGAMLFNVMDGDKNGRVTLEEWRSFHEREFRRKDKNDDSVISREEMAAPPPQRPGGPGGPGGPAGAPPFAAPGGQGAATAYPAQ